MDGRLSQWKELKIWEVETDEALHAKIFSVLEHTPEVSDADMILFLNGGDKEKLLFEGAASVSMDAAEPEVIRLKEKDVYNLVGTDIFAIAYAKELTKDAGNLNTLLPAMRGFEWACRLAEYTEKCVAVSCCGDQFGSRLQKLEKAQQDGKLQDRAVPDTGTAQPEQSAYTCAYIIRRHLKRLTALGIMDQVFQQFCAYMQQIGAFSKFQQVMNRFLSDEAEYVKIARQTAPFVVLRGDETCYGVLQNFADDLSEALIRQGEAVVKVGGWFSEYEKLQNICVKGVVGFQAKALGIDFFRSMRGPKFQFWLDYPLYSRKSFENITEDYYFLCQDENYAVLMRDYYHVQNAIQFPPAGKKCLKGKQERCYDIVFIGTYFETDEDRLSGEERIFYDYMIVHPALTFERGLKELLIKNGKSITREEFADLMISLKPACRSVIGYFRTRVISVILEAGFTVHVYGDSWENYQGLGKERLAIHPQVTVEESLQELAKARIGLNIMSWHKAGMTGREANIRLSGGVCVTEETAYIKDHMRDGEEVVCFTLDQLADLPDKIRKLLEDPQKRKKIADNAYEKALKEHTWERRAQQLAELASKVSAGKL